MPISLGITDRTGGDATNGVNLNRMSLRLGALQDALLDGGTRPELAERAAEELANYETRLATIDRDLSVLKFMVATVIALVVGNLWLTFNVLSRLR